MSGAYSNVFGDCVDLEQDNRLKCDRRPPRTVRRTGAVSVLLGLLCLILLAVILGLVAQNFSAITYWSQHQISRHEFENLTSRWNELQMRDNLPERKRQSPDLCSTEWLEINNKCYYISAEGVTKSWPDSKQDCEQRGGRLVIISAKSEMKFFSLLRGNAWIGLSDRENEGRWMWEDGTSFKNPKWWTEGEPNDANENEDCAHLNRVSNLVGLNDNECNALFSYICEAKPMSQA